MKPETKKWIEAGMILEKDPLATVICPECGIGHLIVKDEIAESWNKLDRYLICDNCGKWNVLTMAIPENYPTGNPIDTSKNR